MSVSPVFKAQIENHLNELATKDELFATTLKKEKKNINDCCTYILNQVKASGCSGFADDEIFNMAIHYYDEDVIEVGKPINGQVVVNHHVELTEEDITAAKEKAFEKEVEKQEVAPYKVMFWDIPKTIQSSYITEWFDTVGITVDVMPRMADENKIVFEPNTFCLKHEIVTEDFIQFETRQEAINNAIIQANVIFNVHFVAEC